MIGRRGGEGARVEVRIAGTYSSRNVPLRWDLVSILSSGAVGPTMTPKHYCKYGLRQAGNSRPSFSTRSFPRLQKIPPFIFLPSRPTSWNNRTLYQEQKWAYIPSASRPRLRSFINHLDVTGRRDTPNNCQKLP